MFPLTPYRFTPFLDVLKHPDIDAPDLIGDSKGIATSFHVSNMLLDEHIPEVDEFRIRFMAMGNSASQPSGMSSSSGISVADKKEIGFTRTISQLHSTKEVRGCWFYGKVSSILSWKSWAYLGCYDPICFKNVVKDNGEFVCSKCETRFLEGVWRYSLRLRVKHKRSYADIMLWNGESQRLIGKAAEEFLDHIDGDNLVSENCWNEISSLVGQEFLFKIDSFQINPSGGGKIYSINMISENKSKIGQLKSANGSDSEGYNYDSDLDLLFDEPAAVESNVSPAFPENDGVQTPLSKRPFEDDLFSPGAATSTQASCNKKLKGIKIGKP